jgi:hypothetical protein
MTFGIINGPPSYLKVVNKAFKDYLDKFMKMFLNDFIVYGPMDIHLEKFKLYFQKYREFGISLNPDECAFMVFLRMIQEFIVSKKGKLLDLEKIQDIIQMPLPTNP